MDVMKYKTITIPIENTTITRNALLITQRDKGWKWAGVMIPQKPQEEILKFEKKFPVGDVIRGMLGWLAATRNCRICGAEPGYPHVECPGPAFLEAFADE